MVRRVISLYIVSIIVLTILIFIARFKFECNIFTEIGALLVVLALSRGFWEISKLDLVDKNLSNIFTSHQKLILKIDLIIVIIGTLINGFSNILFALIMLIKI